MKQIKNSYIIFSLFYILFVSSAYADSSLLSLFPLNHYDQNISTWIKPTTPNFDKALISEEVQQSRFNIFYEHYFGSLSPWSSDYINQVLRQSSLNSIALLEKNLISQFSNQAKPGNEIGYGENFRPYSNDWIASIENNMHLSQFNSLTYQANNRAIAIDNLHARVLPTNDVHFYNAQIAGQGYPFDNLQMSALWAGTPVYILGETLDHAWYLVLTPDYIAWVNSAKIARTDSAFIDTWTRAAKNKLAAIIRTQTSIIDEKGNFLFLAYVGAVFPAHTAGNMQIMVPAADADHHAIIKNAQVSFENASFMPQTLSPHHVANIMSTLVGRTYGWGNMYFYNDCSAELKNLLAPFGIWLPRHSAEQVNVGRMVDMSAASPDKRLSYLLEHGQGFLTLVYIGGHVLMYIGNYPNPLKDRSLMAMTYQNIWGLSPNPPQRRSIIGKSVFLPMLLQYPEDNSLVSLAAKTYFQISFLNELPSANLLMGRSVINIKSLIYPDALFK